MIRSHVKLFVDDTKVYHRIEDISDCQDLQKDLNSLNNWSQQRKLAFHPQKSRVLRIGKNSPYFSYTMTDKNGNKLEFKEVLSVKHLGVIIDNKLTFSEHVDSIVSAANKLVGLIRQSIISLDKKSFAILFKSSVGSKLE